LTVLRVVIYQQKKKTLLVLIAYYTIFKTALLILDLLQNRFSIILFGKSIF